MIRTLTLPGFGAPPPMPAPVDRAAIAEEAARQRAKELRARRGRASTIMTGPMGVGAGSETISRATASAAEPRTTMLGQ